MDLDLPITDDHTHQMNVSINQKTPAISISQKHQ